VRYLTAIAVVAIVGVAGCGGGTSDEDQVRESAKQLAGHAREHEWGDFCAGTTEPDECTKALAGLEAIGVDAADYIPSDEVADRAKVTVNGDRATMDATADEDAEYVRRGDRWLLVWKG
jgi:hypothetical protein